MVVVQTLTIAITPTPFPVMVLRTCGSAHWEHLWSTLSARHPQALCLYFPFNLTRNLEERYSTSLSPTALGIHFKYGKTEVWRDYSLLPITYVKDSYISILETDRVHFPRWSPLSGIWDFAEYLCEQVGTKTAQGATLMGVLSFSWPRGTWAWVQPDRSLWEVAGVGWWEELLWLCFACGHHPLEWQCQAGSPEPHQGQRCFLGSLSSSAVCPFQIIFTESPRNLEV